MKRVCATRQLSIPSANDGTGSDPLIQPDSLISILIQPVSLVSIVSGKYLQIGNICLLFD